MKFKSMMIKALAALATVPALATSAFAFTANPAHRESYNGLTPHAHYDQLWHETMLDITVIGVIFSVFCLWLLLGFRRSASNQMGQQPDLPPQARIGWAVIPMVLFLADDLFLFAMGFELHNHYREVPADAQEVKLTGAMWSWTYEYENGVETYDELVVPVGKPFVMRMTSDDVVHSHYMNQFRVTEDLMPGRITWQWAMPDAVGESVVTCREYCGENHSRMFGKVKVLSQADYDEFMASEMGEADITPAAEVAKTATSEAKI
jgi:cytochrome c oxidase subunit 2